MSKNFSSILRTGNNTPLPIASTSVLGGVRVDGTTITISNGTISGANTYTLPTASDTEKGGVKVGSGLAIDGSGTLSITTMYFDGGTAASVYGGLGLTIINAGGAA